MPWSQAEWWATDGGVGSFAGTSLANAADIDPAGADIWTIIAANGPADKDITINLCADSPVSVSSACTVSADSSAINIITIQGRTAADDADAEVTLDAGGGAFSALDLVTADRCVVMRVHGTNTDQSAGNNGINVGANADNASLIDCRGSWAYDGIYGAGAYYVSYIRPYAHNNVHYGLSIAGAASSIVIDPIAHNNGGTNIYSVGYLVRPLSYDSGGSGVFCYGATGGVVSRSGSAGLGHITTTYPCFLLDMIFTDNANWGVTGASTSYSFYLHRCADYGNSSGRISISGTLLGDVDNPNLTADPFVEAAPKKELSAGAAGATATGNGWFGRYYHPGFQRQ